jgi:signal transduction histidine kinase
MRKIGPMGLSHRRGMADLGGPEQDTLEQKLRRAASEWTQTFDTIESPILILSESLAIRRLNRAAARLLDKTPQESIGVGLEDLTGELWDAVIDLVSRARANRDAAEHHARVEGFGRSWSVRVHPTVSPTTSEQWFVTVATDVTDLSHLRESLKRQERLAAVGSLVANISHEVRNYLFSISGLVEAMERRFEQHRDLQIYIASLGGEVRRLRRLMTGLLEYGRPEELQRSRESTRSLMREAVTAVRGRAETRRVDVRVVDRNGDTSVSVDRVRWIQVLVNVLDNAIAHSPTGGEVTLELDELSEQGVDQVRFRVRDQGPGFEEALLPRLFEPFFSRRPGGIGLGLSVVQRLVDLHGGDVQLSNSSGGGALVEIVLPCSEPAAGTSRSGEGDRQGEERR